MRATLTRALCFFLFPGFVLWATCAKADVLIYSEQGNNPNWSSPNNWFMYDSQNKLQPVFHPPVAGDTAIVGGTVDAQGNLIQLAGLILNANATIKNGGFVVGTVTMHGGQSGGTTSFTGSVLEILTEMDVIGGGCAFADGTLTIDSGATAYIGVGGTGALSYSGSKIINGGQISLQFYGSSLEGGSNLINLSGAVISSSTNTSLMGDASMFDNSGTVRSDHGTLTISGFRNWTSSSGLSKYKTTATDAQILFYSGITIPAGITNIFSGIGTNVFASSCTNNGTALVGVLVDDQNLDPGNLEFSGSLYGTGTVHVVALPNLASVFLVNPNSGGTIYTNTINIDPGGQFLINYNTGGQGLILASTIINNSGTINWSGPGGITMGGSAVINNIGLFAVQTPGTTANSIIGGKLPFGGAINNSGTFRRNGGSALLTIVVDFNNSGLLDVESGQVQLTSGSDSGSFNTAPGMEISIGGNNTTNFFMAGAQFTGTNFIRLKSGTIFLTGDIIIGQFSLEGGTLDGPGQITITNLFPWSGGLMQGNGAVAIPLGANATLTGGSFTQRTFNNSGLVLMTNGFVLADDAAIFNNLATGQLVLKNNGGFGFPNTGKPHPGLRNFGSIIDASPSTAPLSFIITNSGSFLVQSNSLNCYQYIQTAGTTTIATNATLNSGIAGALLLGGIVTGNGAIYSSYNTTNSGATIIPGNSPGTLSINNNNYIQNPGGTLNIEIGGTNAGSQFDRLALSGGTLNGTLKVTLINGFQPAVGDVYYFLSTPFFGSVTGRFTNYVGLETGNHIVLVPLYQDFGVSLVAVAQPVISGPTRVGTNSVISFHTTTGLTNFVQFTDTLTPPNWQTLTNIVGDGIVHSVTNGTTSRQGFYRIGFR